MPEFILDTGSHAGAAAFNALDAFTRGYIEAAFFTECHADNPELESATVADIAPDSLAAIIADCATWQAANAALLEQAYECDYSAEQAGRDYWFTRNGHGVGFWDRAELESNMDGYEAATAEIIAARDNPAAWHAAVDKRNAITAESIGAKLSKAAGRSEAYVYRGDGGAIHFG